MNARRRTPRVCACAAPIPYRDPGEPVACAKCGHRLGGETPEAPGVGAAAADGPPAAAPHRGGRRPAITMSKDGRQRHASRVGLATTSTDAPFEWPFASLPTLRQADRQPKGAG
jgi:hypothetical protein